MSDDNELIQKALTTTNIGSGNTAGQGGLTYEQADRFIDYMWDATVLGSLITRRRMRAVEEEWDVIAIGAKLVRLATEAVDDGVNVAPTFSKLSITTKKLRLDWELSSESLEDNIEGDALEDHIVRLMATQFGNDVEDLIINGDTALTGDPLYKAFDGFRKRAVAGGHVVDHAGGALDRTVFNKALKAMPRKYLAARPNFKFLTGSGAIQDYIFSLQQTENGFVSPESLAAAGINQAVRTEGPAGFQTGNAFGVAVQEVPYFSEVRAGDYSGATGNHTDVWLTDPKNLIWGIKREVQVEREYKPKKDTIEYTVFSRQGVQIQNVDAVVVVKNVKVSA